MLVSKLLKATDITDDSYVPNWGLNVFQSFSSDMLDEERLFPCFLGVEGLKNDWLRFTFIDSLQTGMDKLAEDLRTYLKSYKQIGRYTSFVAFFKPEPLKTIEEYEKDFWRVLQNLHKLDDKPWPQEIPVDPDNHMWEFSFHDQPMFVVCNTPAHKKRKSRYSKTFMMTFQPRWVFEGIDENTVKGRNIQKIVRNRLKHYDDVAAHPELGWYGKESNLEWKQYYLKDDNEKSAAKCPFHASKPYQSMKE
ncbi:YqcI/YcgG family protein [Bacillus carboniphilus]|uniref:YqcI/YcgG family protein n=1 Tax=Bacillus carboniphilus TaxID=86663 RepID=A0ABY9JWW1_9BACI|nr:YqcI/YcgG family protein [Bacillus carboniphilus]WLR43268.1 YqcI/YcgG family protein [Bacillus carboniphilus]